MGRKSLTQEQKAETSKRMKAHWDRCRMWAAILGISASDVNYHWSATIRPAIGDAEWDGPKPPVNVIESVKMMLAERLLADAKRTNAHAESNYRRSQYRPNPKKSSPEEPPDAEQQAKIMLWAINKCGGIENATKAFNNAVEFKRQVDG